MMYGSPSECRSAERWFAIYIYIYTHIYNAPQDSLSTLVLYISGIYAKFDIDVSENHMDTAKSESEKIWLVLIYKPCRVSENDDHIMLCAISEDIFGHELIFMEMTLLSWILWKELNVLKTTLEIFHDKIVQIS